MAEEQKYLWINLRFYKSLAEQVLLFGVPRSFILLNAFIAFFFIMNFGFWYIIPVNIGLHFLCIYLAKDDPQFFDCLMVYIKKKNYYST